MFKKPFTVQAQNLLSKKDAKALKSQIASEYPALDPEDIEELLPEGQVKLLKLDTRGLLYVTELPVFFDPEGRGEIFPTLHTLWLYPNFMPELTIHDGVSKFVLNGADLMLPGVVVPANGVAGFGTVAKNQKRCIKVEGNPYPIAVGKMLVNQSQMEKMKGKGLEPCHIFKDALWQYSFPSGKGVPNAGFAEKDDEVTKCSELSYVPGKAQVAENSTETSGDVEASPKAVATDESTPKSAPVDETTPKVAETTPKSFGDIAASDLSQDDLLDFCFMRAFTVDLVDDKSLPVEASELYEKHMKPNRPEGTTLDVKKSSHKQIGKYLNALRKAKTIDVVEKKGVISVTKVVRDHKVMVQFQEKFAALAGEASTSNSTAPSGGGKVVENLPPPVVTVKWAPQKATECIFKKVGKSKSELYTWEEVENVVAEYIKKSELGSGSKDEPVKLDEELITAVYRVAGGQKKDVTFPEQVEFGEFMEKLEDRMKQHTVIDVAGLGQAVRTGPPEASLINVTLSRKGAHNVTKIEHLEAYCINVPAMGDDLKKKLSCTVNVEESEAKNSKEKLLIVQGHCEQELADYLLQKYGITKSFMSVKK